MVILLRKTQHVLQRMGTASVSQNGCGGIDLASAHGLSIVAHAVAADKAFACPGAVADEVDPA